MKACQIYKTKKHYKIATMYRLESGSYILSNPIFIIPLEANDKELSVKIFEAIKNSRLIYESEEDDIWLGTQLLKELKEKSYNDLYKNSGSCTIYLEKGLLEIEPNKYLGKNEGLEAIQEKKSKFDYVEGDELKVTEKVIELLNEKR